MTEGKITEESIDSVDIKILKELQQNGKLTIKELAEKVGLSTSPVHERQRRLEQLGYIKSYRAVLNPKMVGCNMIVLCNIRLKQHSRQHGLEFVEAINAIDEVSECWNTSGEYDFMMKLHVKDMDHYQDFVLNTLGTLDCIGSLHSIFVIGEVKNSHSLPIYK